MKYIKGKYYVEKVEANKIAKIYGTPAYCYSENKLKKNIRTFKNNFKSIDPLICFSIKSNNNLQIVKIIKNAGLGADVVSKGELMFALKAGISEDTYNRATRILSVPNKKVLKYYKNQV